MEKITHQYGEIKDEEWSARKPTLDEVIEKLDEIVEWINSHKDQLL